MQRLPQLAPRADESHPLPLLRYRNVSAHICAIHLDGQCRQPRLPAENARRTRLSGFRLDSGFPRTDRAGLSTGEMLPLDSRVFRQETRLIRFDVIARFKKNGPTAVVLPETRAAISVRFLLHLDKPCGRHLFYEKREATRPGYNRNLRDQERIWAKYAATVLLQFTTYWRITTRLAGDRSTRFHARAATISYKSAARNQCVYASS